MTVECPVCKADGRVVTNEATMNFFGFTINSNGDKNMFAPFGICTADNCTKNFADYSEFGSTKYGTPLIEKREKGVETNAVDLQNFNTKKIKGDYANSFGTKLHFLDPPYSGVTGPQQVYYGVIKDLGGLAISGVLEDKDKRGVNKPTEYQDKNMWFEVLGHLLVDLNRIKTKSPSNKLSLRQILFIISYLHKTGEMSHIEPIWMFARHIGIGGREVNLGFSLWPKENIISINNLLKLINTNAPSKNNIESLLNASKRIGTYKLKTEESNLLLNESVELLNKLSEMKTEGGTYVIQLCFDKSWYSSLLKISEDEVRVVGLVEALIIKTIVERNKGTGIKYNLAQDIIETLFPSPVLGTPFWKTTLSENALLMVNQWDNFLKICNL